MPDEVQNQTTQNSQTTQKTAPSTGVISEVASKINEAENILVALSSDPSVDEMAAAIGLSLYLDKLGKHATAIYSGTTPNALEFLKPEETFESTADALQDFVIALNKEKADHLRYKLDGDFVKIFITPYRSKISEEDLDFSYGDFNIDLVLALDVANGIDLDSALREHGRIMHDAIVVNITTGNPGKLGEIEWSDTSASSVSEMIAELIYSMKDVAMDKEEATAFLTGIVAATDRFSTAATTPATMLTASKLMESGANQQLVAKNITSDTDNELLSSLNKKIDEPKLESEPEEAPAEAPAKNSSDTDLDIKHTDEEKPEATISEASETPEAPEAEASEKDDSLLDDLKAAEASLATAGAETTPEAVEAPIQIPEEPADAGDALANAAAAVSAAGAAADTFNLPNLNNETIGNEEEKKIAPSADFTLEDTNDNATKYGQMLEEALAESAPQTPQPVINPAMSMAPEVPSAPEINGVPEINYMPLPSDEVLPPPPAPPVDFSAGSMPTPPAMPMEAPVAPAMPEPIVPAPVSEPVAPVATPEPIAAPEPTPAPEAAPAAPVTPPSNNAFKIPGM